jgi:hypothetical protein
LPTANCAVIVTRLRFATEGDIDVRTQSVPLSDGAELDEPADEPPLLPHAAAPTVSSPHAATATMVFRIMLVPL